MRDAAAIMVERGKRGLVIKTTFPFFDKREKGCFSKLTELYRRILHEEQMFADMEPKWPYKTLIVTLKPKAAFPDLLESGKRIGAIIKDLYEIEEAVLQFQNNLFPNHPHSPPPTVSQEPSAQ